MEQTQRCRFDLIILGASGFTGKYVIREALKFLNAPHSPIKSIALAGRSPSKISQALQWASKPNPPPEIPILTADVADPPSLTALCAQTSLILNCVGPFRLYGEPVVAACAAAGCDYLDITGEAEFMERVEAKYHHEAAESGALVVSACGFDSVPAELGFLFNSRQWVAPAVPNRVDAYFSLESEKSMAVNLTSYESATLMVETAKQLKESRSRFARTKPVIPGPLPPNESIEKEKKIGSWALNWPPSSDAAVVGRTLSTLTENPGGLPGLNESDDQVAKREAFWSSVKPAHFGMKICSKSLLGIFRMIIIAIIIVVLGCTGFGRRLLLAFPSFFSLGLFTKKGPSEEEVESASFKMWFVGHGYSDGSLASQGNAKPDMEIITRVTGPEVGYVSTPIILIQCAIVLLTQRNNLPKGGVYPPGIVFGPTDLQQKLQHNGISFDVISTTTIFS